MQHVTIENILSGALSPDRRVLRVALNVKNGVDQIRVLVATDNNLESQ